LAPRQASAAKLRNLPTHRHWATSDESALYVHGYKNPEPLRQNHFETMRALAKAEALEPPAKPTAPQQPVKRADEES
jgi:hypothetical protein